MTANANELNHTNNKISVPEIIMSAADINIDVVGGKDVGMVEGEDELPIAAPASGDTSSQTQMQVDQDDDLAEKERIFMGTINQMIDQYNAKNKQQDDASLSCLPQKRPASTLTETNKRRKESTGMLQKDALLTI